MWVALEAKRQEELLKIREELKEIIVKPLEIKDITDLLKNSTSKIIVKTIIGHLPIQSPLRIYWKWAIYKCNFWVITALFSYDDSWYPFS